MDRDRAKDPLGFGPDGEPKRQHCKNGCGNELHATLDLGDECGACGILRRAIHNVGDANAVLAIFDSMRPAWTPFDLVSLEPGDPSLNPKFNAMVREGETFLNSRYQVQRRVDIDGDRRMVHLSIKTIDRNTRHDWRDFQRIKNELIGPDAEAVELFPREDRLVDTSNQYHLWCMVDHHVPVGFPSRLVAESATGKARQRPFEVKPEDLMDLTAERINAMVAASQDVAGGTE
jgi:hypothetical protein